MVAPAVHSAAATATAPPYVPMCPLPGCTITRTPAKPIRTALQRHRPVRSPSTSAASSVAKIGTEKPIAVASASGKRTKVRKFKPMATSPIAIRATCAPTRFVLSEANPGPSATQPTAHRAVPI